MFFGHFVKKQRIDGQVSVYPLQIRVYSLYGSPFSAAAARHQYGFICWMTAIAFGLITLGVAAGFASR